MIFDPVKALEEKRRKAVRKLLGRREKSELAVAASHNVSLKGDVLSVLEGGDRLDEAWHAKSTVSYKESLRSESRAQLRALGEGQPQPQPLPNELQPG